ncbi:MAG TPA: folate-binding protein [Albitalea sp.]|nr:folate-binding protein [Albitalea sp.]
MTTSAPLAGIAPLTHWGVIRARGDDAATFLHSQLTNDFSQLGPNEARLAGYCSAKGRLLASFVAWSTGPDEVLLACHKSVLAPTLKRLSMFVLRSKCKLSDASAEVHLHGLAGQQAEQAVGALAVWTKRDVDGTQLIRMPDAAGVARALLATSADAPAGPALPLDTWRWLEVQSGIAVIEAATAEHFVPQMLNFELVGYVNFQKGCYPGQEIVARAQYRGTVKRRMFLFDVDAAALPGQEVFHSADPGQPAGQVANAAPRIGGSGSSVLVELKLAALEGGEIHLASPDGPMLAQRDLPYPVLSDAGQPA